MREGDLHIFSHYPRELGPVSDWGHNAFVLAMAHWQFGEKEEARQWYAKGVVRMHGHEHDPVYGEDLQRFRAEAEELLGIQKPPPAKDKPATTP
jgi:hypothetical protein